MSYQLKLLIRIIVTMIQIPLFVFSYLVLLPFAKIKRFRKVSLVICGGEIAKNIYHSKYLVDRSINICFYPSYFYKVKYDFKGKGILGNMIYLPMMLSYLILKSNNFYYIWTEGFFFDIRFDMFLLKKVFKKKIIIRICGSEIRSYIKSNEFYKKEGIEYHTFYTIDLAEENKSSTREKHIKSIAKYYDKYSDIILSNKYDPITYLNKEVTPNQPFIDINNYKCNYDKFHQIDNLRIVHAPSSPITKGTQLVRAAIAKLRKKGYVFEYIELQGLSNEKVIEILSNSHISINDMYCITTPGMLGVESMICGNLVIQPVQKKYMGRFYEQMDEEPWLVTEYWELYDNLEYAIQNPNIIKEKGLESIEFVKNNYTLEIAKERFKLICSENGIELD